MAFVHQNFWLIMIVLTSGIMLAFPNLFSGMAGIAAVDISQAIQMINHDDALVLDVREHNEFNAGHIAGSRHIPLGQLKDNLHLLEKFKEQPIVVNCRSGNRSAAACGILKKAGFSRVYNLSGGIVAWQRQQMPTTTKS